jgi:hypothetical protein
MWVEEERRATSSSIHERPVRDQVDEPLARKKQHVPLCIEADTGRHLTHMSRAISELRLCCPYNFPA